MSPLNALFIVLPCVALISAGVFLYYAVGVAGMKEAGLSDELIDQVLRSPK